MGVSGMKAGMLAAGRFGIGAQTHSVTDRHTPADQWPGIRPGPSMVNPHDGEPYMPPFQKILVPVDGSSTSNKALDYALKLAKEDHSQVRALHATEVLQKAVVAAQALNVPADTKLVDQPGQRLGQTVADEAASWGADLVVVGTHGRRGVDRVLLGSGAEQIVRMSPVAVLTVRGE